MSFEGTIVNGGVVLDAPAPLPDGTRVKLVVEAPATPALGERLMKFAGVIKDMPADFAEEHDHYIHGTPRRTPKAEE